MKLFHSILMVLWQLGSYQGQVCQFSTRTILCKRIQQEDFMYQVYKNEAYLKNHQVFYVEIVDSNVSFIEDFIDLDRHFGSNIYTLKIRSSSIRRIGQNAFQNLKNLEDLDLGGNFIEDIGFIENIVSNLRYLNLEYNRIRILDLNIFNYAWKLNSIIMRGNNIRKITALNSFKKFTFMDLSFNQITAFNETALNCFFASINLSFNKLQNINILDKTYIDSYGNSKKIVVNLSGNNITSLGSYEKTSFSCDELYLTSVPTELPNEFHITKVFSLANTKTEQWNRTLFNIDIVKFGPSPVIDFSNSSITKFSESYFRDVHSSLLNLSHNDMTVMNKSIFNNSFVNHLDLSFSNVKNVSVNFFEGLKNCEIVNLTGNHLESIHDICKFVEFSSIDLSHNRIKRIGVNAFKNCNRLYELKLSNSGIEYIEPNSFDGSKSSLVHLDLSKNNLINLKENYFVNLTSIETIDLSSNNLGVLETNMFYNLSVMDIKLWNTSIKYIQNRAFNNLYNLQSLNLSNIGITFMEPYAFFNLPSLDTIDLRKNNFATIESHTFDIPIKTLLLNGNGIKHIKSGSFENLSLNELNLSNLGIQKLEPFSFSGLSYLSVLDLRDNNITEIQKNVFFNLTIDRFLLENNNISKIWALDNSVRVNELSLSFRGVLEPQTISKINLKKLLLVNSSIKSLKTDCFMGLYNLEELHFIDSDIGSYEPGALNGLFHLKDLDASNILKKTNKLFRNSFSDLHSLRTLRISNINLTEIRVGAFSGLSNLKKLHLSNNSLQKVSGSEFDGLESLDLLDLSHNSISSINLDNILSKTRSLKLLRLSFNQLHSFSVMDLNSSLETLLLDNNNINGNYYSSRFQGLVKLKILHLQNNNLESISFEMFRNLSNLEELRLDGNALGPFIPGLFGGLDNLKILNLSKNPRLFQGSRNLNLFNLRRLTTIILTNTALGDYFDYRSLLADNPILQTIELNYNSFSCTVLLEMLRYFEQINPENNKNYNYFINFAAEDPRYDINNVAGIVCDYRNQ